MPATPERNLPARYNICPTTTIDAVIERDAKRALVPMRWGLVPSWWKSREIPLVNYINITLVGMNGPDAWYSNLSLHVRDDA